jgi:hypothetical protein
VRRLIVLLFACGSDVDRNIEPYVRLEQGVYGQMTSDATPNTKIRVGTFEPDTNIRLGLANTDARGIYQLTEPIGTVELCLEDETPHSFAASVDCIVVLVPAGISRQDWTLDDAGPHWCDGPCSD